MQGLFITGSLVRPKSKKSVKEAIAAGLPVRIEATSMMGNEYDGMVADAPAGEYHFVGPDPYRARNFYGTIKVSSDRKVKVT